MSPVIPRPVGPTTGWNGSLTTTASLPRNRTQVRPYQVSSIAWILTQRPASPLHPEVAVRRAQVALGRRGLFLELAWGTRGSVAFAGLAVGHPILPARVGLADHPRTTRPRGLA